ncbi:diguanylate cyclase [Sphaerotilus sp.]|uniref:GGDEF domain-containing protein n=1 Tax=Sphaerotilus sp. TaxID=2093942 RepID=UPI002ACDF742|nr:diguanylate cyclase [Sphaerotilus sp.]MDZ7858149.1 diguanylate cyclase [Sphaerotilus sp.]
MSRRTLPAWWPRPGVELRLSLGLVAIFLAVIFLLDVLFGLVPDRARTELVARQTTSTALALLVTQGVEQGGRLPHGAVRQLVAQDPEVLSVALQQRGRARTTLVGDHAAHWTLPPGERSTLTQVRVAIQDAQRQPWGTLEIAFRPIYPTTLAGVLASPVVRALLAIALLSGLAIWLYLRRVLQHLDPGQVIPERVRDAFDVLDEGIVILDPQARVMMANEAFRRLAPLRAAGQPPPGVTIGQPVTQLDWLCDALTHLQQDGSPETAQPWTTATRTAAPSEEREIRITQASDAAQAREVLVKCTPILDPGGQVRGSMLRLRDVSALHQLNRALQASQQTLRERNDELSRLATRDPMTGCLNRRAFFEQATRLFELARQRGEGLVCVMADIDHFKQFNDHHGHATGDQVIQAVAAILSGGVRGTDLVCRYGGEEFCLLLPQREAADVQSLAERLRREIEDTAGQQVDSVAGLRITSSFGMALFEPGLASLVELVDRADQALYQSKRSGRNRVSRWPVVAETEATSAATSETKTA